MPKIDSELMEVLEHFPEVDKAVAAVKMAKKYVVAPEAKEAHRVQWQCV